MTSLLLVLGFLTAWILVWTLLCWTGRPCPGCQGRLWHTPTCPWPDW
jgi:hypothetical protein